MVRVQQALVVLALGFSVYGLITCLGCAPDTQVVELPTTNNIDPGKIAGGNVDDQIVPVSGDNTPIDYNKNGTTDEPFESTVVNGELCEPPYVVLYDADGNAVECAPNALYTCKGDMALFIRIEGYEEPHQVCEEIEQPPVYDEAICENLSAADGTWQALWDGGPKGMSPIDGLFMEVKCEPTADGCRVTPTGDGSKFNDVEFIGTEFPLKREYGIYLVEMDITPDGLLVQTSYAKINGVYEFNGERFFQR